MPSNFKIVPVFSYSFDSICVLLASLGRRAAKSFFMKPLFLRTGLVERAFEVCFIMLFVD